MLKTILLASSLIFVHDWYDEDCCSNKDCKPVPCSDITEDEKNTFYKGRIMDKNQVRVSKDNQCHACIQTYSDKPVCVYVYYKGAEG